MSLTLSFRSHNVSARTIIRANEIFCFNQHLLLNPDTLIAIKATKAMSWEMRKKYFFHTGGADETNETDMEYSHTSSYSYSDLSNHTVE